MLKTYHGYAKYSGSIKQSTLGVSLAMGLGCFSSAPMAALSTSTLNFTLGAAANQRCAVNGTFPNNCKYGLSSGSDIVGSYFTMDVNGDGIVQIIEKTPIGSFNGIEFSGGGQDAFGSHSGPVNGSENPDIDMPWEFFGNTGMHQTTSSFAVISDGGATKMLSMGGWSITWNDLDSIPMVNTSGGATIVCDAICNGGEDYEMDAAFHIAGAGFTTVPYSLHLEGTISGAVSLPVANDDSANTIIGNSITIDVAENDASGTDPKFTPDSVTSTDPDNGSTVDNADNTVTYTPDGPTGDDTFTYTIANKNATSFPGTVTVNVQSNIAPLVDDDELISNPVAFGNFGGALDIPVLDNDRDFNNAPGLPGGIDTTSVEILSQPAIGACVVNEDGTVTYSQEMPIVPFVGACSYRISDIDSSASPALLSNTGFIDISIIGIESDWPVSLAPNIIPTLFYAPGVPNTRGPDGTSDFLKPPASGSYFSFLIRPSTNTNTFTLLEPGPDGGMIIGYEQVAGNSHAGHPDGTEPTTVEAGWNFFSNTGYAYTKNGGIQVNPDGALEFSGETGIGTSPGRYNITWNGIPTIDLGGSPSFPEDTGLASISCNPAPCEHGSDFTLDYKAHIFEADPSGYGSIVYSLHTEGTVGFLDGTPVSSDGNLDFDRLTSTDVEADIVMEVQCAAGCFTYTIHDVKPRSSVSTVIPLIGGVPVTGEDFNGGPVPPELRMWDGSAWFSFITNPGTDTVLSAESVEGEGILVCPPPGDVAYGSLTEGDHCLEITMRDNGLNDQNPEVGTISDPGGLGIREIVFIPTTDITIDIEPRKQLENVLSLNKNQPVKVAIVGDETFDVSQVDPSTVRFGPEEASPVHFRTHDFNHDGFNDLILTFNMGDTGIVCGDTEATLTGETVQPFHSVQGTDSFTIKGCP